MKLEIWTEITQERWQYSLPFLLGRIVVPIQPHQVHQQFTSQPAHKSRQMGYYSAQTSVKTFKCLSHLLQSLCCKAVQEYSRRDRDVKRFDGLFGANYGNNAVAFFGN